VETTRETGGRKRYWLFYLTGQRAVGNINIDMSKACSLWVKTNKVVEVISSRTEVSEDA